MLELFSHQFIQYAFLAGTLIAIICAIIGYFVVLRAQAFAAESLSCVGFTGANIQYDGTARLVPPGDEFIKLTEEYFSVHPELKKFNKPGHGFIVVTPNWIRMSDYTKTPPQVDEHTF